MEKQSLERERGGRSNKLWTTEAAEKTIAKGVRDECGEKILVKLQNTDTHTHRRLGVGRRLTKIKRACDTDYKKNTHTTTNSPHCFKNQNEVRT